MLELRGKEAEATRPLSGVRAVPDGLKVPERTPDYVPPAAPTAEAPAAAADDPTAKLDPYLDVKVKGRTRLAPVLLAALAGAFVILFQVTEGLGSLPDLRARLVGRCVPPSAGGEVDDQRYRVGDDHEPDDRHPERLRGSQLRGSSPRLAARRRRRAPRRAGRSPQAEHGSTQPAATLAAAVAPPPGRP